MTDARALTCSTSTRSRPHVGRWSAGDKVRLRSRGLLQCRHSRPSAAGRKRADQRRSVADQAAFRGDHFPALQMIRRIPACQCLEQRCGVGRGLRSRVELLLLVVLQPNGGCGGVPLRRDGGKSGIGSFPGLRDDVKRGDDGTLAPRTDVKIKYRDEVTTNKKLLIGNLVTGRPGAARGRGDIEDNQAEYDFRTGFQCDAAAACVVNGVALGATAWCQ